MCTVDHWGIDSSCLAAHGNWSSKGKTVERVRVQEPVAKKNKNYNRDITTKMAFLSMAGLRRVRTSTHHRLTQIDATGKQLYDPREEKIENTTQNVKTLVLMTIVIYTSEIRKGCPKLVRENPALEQSSCEARCLTS